RRAFQSCQAPTTSTSLSSAVRPAGSPPLFPAGATCRRRCCAASKPSMGVAFAKRRSVSMAPAISDPFKGGRHRMTGLNELIVFDPRGTVETDPLALAPRVASPDRLRLGVLNNTKWNASRLLRKTVAKLQDQASFAAVNYYSKESFSKDADPALIEAIAANND